MDPLEFKGTVRKNGSHLGHRDVNTTMIYTHILHRRLMGARCQFDDM